MRDDGGNIAVNSLDEMQGSVDGDFGFGFEFGSEFNEEDMLLTDEMSHGHVAQYDFTELDNDHFIEDAPLDIEAPSDNEDEDSLNGRTSSFGSGSEEEEECSVSCESESNDRSIAIDNSNDEKSNDGEDSSG